MINDIAKPFWEAKIIGWENDRYDNSKRWGKTLRFRKEFALDYLSSRVPGKNVVELGCGSGDLGPRILDLGAASYVGIDIAENAIDVAEKRIGPAHEARLRYQVADVSSLEALEGDIVFSLGLLDWLDHDQLKHVFELGKKRECLHSFSERKVAPSQMLHRLYVFLAYGYRTKGYIPRYYTVDELRAAANRSLEVRRHPYLSFGAFVCLMPD